jgi:hypothetical protein
VRIHIERGEDLADVQRGSSFVPVRIWAIVEEGRIDRRTELAIAVNGRVRALTRSFFRDGRQQLRAIVPEATIREGFNQVDVFAIERDGARAHRLVWLGGNGRLG